MLSADMTNFIIKHMYPLPPKKRRKNNKKTTTTKNNSKQDNQDNLNMLKNKEKGLTTNYLSDGFCSYVTLFRGGNICKHMPFSISVRNKKKHMIQG